MYKHFICLQVFYLFTCVLFRFNNLPIYLFTSIILIIYKKFLKHSVNLKAFYSFTSIVFIYFRHSIYLQPFSLFSDILFIYLHFIYTPTCILLQTEALQLCIGLNSITKLLTLFHLLVFGVSFSCTCALLCVCVSCRLDCITLMDRILFVG